MSYLVHLSSEAAKTLRRLDKKLSGRIVRRLEELSQAPLDPRRSKQMETARGQRYSRVGDWRIVYTVDEREKILCVLAIRPRSRAYK